MSEALCIRWGLGSDRCVAPYGHTGPCRDASGNTTLTLAAAILAEPRPDARQVVKAAAEMLRTYAGDLDAQAELNALDENEVHLKLEGVSVDVAEAFVKYRAAVEKNQRLAPEPAGVNER